MNGPDYLQNILHESHLNPFDIGDQHSPYMYLSSHSYLCFQPPRKKSRLLRGTGVRSSGRSRVASTDSSAHPSTSGQSHLATTGKISSVPFLKRLSLVGIGGTGTERSNRLMDCPLSYLSEAARGTYDYK